MRTVVLLRGVNVGGVRFAMRDLAAALTDAGFGDVRTVLASGNVLLTSDRDAAGIAEAVSATILERFGFTVAAHVTDLDVLRAAVRDNPFPRTADRHAYVVLPAATTAPAALAAHLAGTDADEEVAVGAGVVHWSTPKGSTLDSAVGKRLARRSDVTTRNLTTLERILAVG